MNKNKLKLKYEGRWHVHGIYKDVLHDPRLSVGSKGVYVALMAFLSPGNECAYPSQAHLCRILSLSRKPLQRYLRELVCLGLLVVEQERTLDASGCWRFGPNLYTLKTRIKPISNSEDISNPVGPFPAYGVPACTKRVGRKTTYKVYPIGKNTHKERITTTKTAEGGAGSAAVSNLETDLKLEETARAFLHRTYRVLVQKLRGQETPITQRTVQYLAQFFANNPGWYPCDVAYAAFKGLLAAERWPKPVQGHDPWFYSRLVDSPQWFAPNRDGTSRIIHTARESGYTGGRDQEAIEAEIRIYLEQAGL